MANGYDDYLLKPWVDPLNGEGTLNIPRNTTTSTVWDLRTVRYKETYMH